MYLFFPVGHNWANKQFINYGPSIHIYIYIYMTSKVVFQDNNH